MCVCVCVSLKWFSVDFVDLVFVMFVYLLPPSEMDWGLFWALLSGSEGGHFKQNWPKGQNMASRIFHTKILEVNIPGGLPVFSGMSPFVLVGS